MSLNKEFLGQSTGIGSLPFTNVEDAIEYCTRFDIPFLPHLPHLDPTEYMVAEALSGKPCRAWDSFSKLTINSLVKVQIAGPWTCYKWNEQGLSFKECLNRIRRKVEFYQRELSGEFLLFFDEPGFAMAKTDEINLCLDYMGDFQNSNCLVGVHCCSDMNWGLFKDSKISIISFDAFISMETIVKNIIANKIYCPGIVNSRGEVISKDKLSIFSNYLLSSSCGQVDQNQTQLNQTLSFLS